jgi:hypothetical protein
MGSDRAGVRGPVPGGRETVSDERYEVTVRLQNKSGSVKVTYLATREQLSKNMATAVLLDLFEKTFNIDQPETEGKEES